MPRTTTILDLTDQRFGQLVVRAMAGITDHYAYWICDCDCGLTCEVSGAVLRAGNTQSCGCARRGSGVANLANRVFGSLKVVALLDINRWSQAIWLCHCSCGHYTSVKSNSLKSGTKSCGCRSALEKFWFYVAKQPGRGCWIWTGRITSSGYGRAPRGLIAKQSNTMAHRLSWWLAHGELPADKFVCHRCDNPLCVNPSHLFLGSALDNSIDAKSKGRTARGSRSGKAKLIDRDVLRMRRLWASGVGIADLVKEFGLTNGTTHNIVSGRSWPHLPGGLVRRTGRAAIRKLQTRLPVVQREYGESYSHRAARNIISTLLTMPPNLISRSPCSQCGKERMQSGISAGQKRVGRALVDVVVKVESDVVFLVEICHSLPMDMRRRRRLNKSGIPWIELLASEILQLPHGPWTAVSSGSCTTCGYREKPYKSGAWSAKRRRRANQAYVPSAGKARLEKAPYKQDPR